MRYITYVLRRAAFAIASVYLVVTVAFLPGNAAIQSDVQNALAFARYNDASPAELARLERSLTSTFGLDKPLLDRLVSFWIDVTTFDWGYSSAFDEPILAVLDGRAITTLTYVLPGIVIAVGLGVAIGLYAALRKNGAIDWSSRLGSYLLLGVPAFMLAVYLLHLRNYEVTLLGGWYLVLPEFDDMTIATLTVAVGLLAGQHRFARASALEQTGETFMKMLRAKGAGRILLARHVLRNAAIPIVSLSITELLAVLVLNIYVIERVLNIRGLARVSLRAVGVVEGGFVYAGHGRRPVADLVGHDHRVHRHQSQLPPGCSLWLLGPAGGGRLTDRNVGSRLLGTDGQLPSSLTIKNTSWAMRYLFKPMIGNDYHG